MKIYIEAHNGFGYNQGLISFPNGDLETAMEDIIGSKNYHVLEFECVLNKNSFKKCDVFELNELLLELEENYHFDVEDVSNLSLLNMLLEDRHHNIDEVSPIIKDGEYAIYHTDDISEIVIEYLENTSIEFSQLIESGSLILNYIDYESYAEEVLMETERYLIDKDNKIIVNMYIL